MLFCAPRTDRTEEAVPAPIGGDRALAAASDRHAVRLAFQSASVLIDAPMFVKASFDFGFRP
jgi:hypothetical protein